MMPLDVIFIFAEPLLPFFRRIFRYFRHFDFRHIFQMILFISPDIHFARRHFDFRFTLSYY